jgi:peptidoglycan-associated lipoprotein
LKIWKKIIFPFGILFANSKRNRKEIGQVSPDRGDLNRIVTKIHHQRRSNMIRRSFIILTLILCLGLILAGCPKKTMVKEEPSITKEEAARLEAERAAKEAQEKEAARMREEEARKAKEEFEKSLVAKKEPGIEGEVFESGLLKDIHFDFDKYNIRPGDAEILKENAALLSNYPTAKIQIEGHCDERGTVEYNLALGERRADNTRKYLNSLGVSSDRISTISYGKERPLDPRHNEEAWTKNRRAHCIVLSK